MSCKPNAAVANYIAAGKAGPHLKCNSNNPGIGLSLQILHALLDWILLAVPIIILVRLKMAWQKKVQCIFPLAIGTSSAVGASKRIYDHYHPHPDITCKTILHSVHLARGKKDFQNTDLAQIISPPNSLGPSSTSSVPSASPPSPPSTTCSSTTYPDTSPNTGPAVIRAHHQQVAEASTHLTESLLATSTMAGMRVARETVLTRRNRSWCNATSTWRVCARWWRTTRIPVIWS